MFDAAGPEYLTYEQMMQILARMLGRRRRLILPVPVLSPELSAYWLRFVSPPTSPAR